MLELDRAFIAENLSPGGSADLLAITIFLAGIVSRESILFETGEKTWE
jgi:triphosphoribosyl-dephospho-CoA synthetase